MGNPDNVVDLTVDTSDGGATADEVVVAATLPVTFHYGAGNTIRARRASPSVLKPLPRTSTLPMKPNRAPSPSSIASRRRTPVQSPASRAGSRAADGTPSRPTRRLSVRDEIRDSQSPPPSSVKPAAPQHPTPQSVNRSPRGRQTPSAQTPKRTEWSVDKIASALTALSEEISHGHTRLVDFLLEEAEKKTPQARHLSTVDTFAGMKPVAIDSGIDPPPGVETMAVKFKASLALATAVLVMPLLTL